MLLRELHHRVKNNLQIIVSLLNLQSKYIKDKGVLQFFKAIQDRVKSMVLIHNKLYQSQDLASIDTTDCIKTLSEHIFRSCNVKPGTVVLKTNIAKLNMNIDTAIPCGLIINELISNSLRHAFVKPIKGRKAEVRINLHKNKAGDIRLVISDSGVGLPKDIDFRNTKSLGLQLVRILVEQLNGTIKLNRSKGTKFTITLKMK